MLSKKITIKIPSGLEARPVALLVQVASQFESSVHVACEDKKVNAKSIMGMMTLGLSAGEEVETGYLMQECLHPSVSTYRHCPKKLERGWPTGGSHDFYTITSLSSLC